MRAQVLDAFGLKPEQFDVQPFGTGHINKTFLASSKAGPDHFILQKINTYVFKQPRIIARNHRLTWEHLAREHPDYLFPRAFPTTDGDDLYHDGDSYWRLMPYVLDTVTIDQADSAKQAYEAARQFGRFAHLTADIDLRDFQPTIPDFHNLTLRFEGFRESIQNASGERMACAAELIDAFLGHVSIAEMYATLVHGGLPNRLMHHDTKINNVLLHRETFEGVCVIDLDTLMPGKIISDLGDMVRTYVCPVSEEERDVERIVIREDYYSALMDGYLSELRDELTEVEKEQLFYAGQFMIYMQGIRFLTDYLDGDVYYPIHYPEHNLVRARNQLTLLERLIEKEPALRRIIRDCL
jgi:Ser/Thr protein kinase RdoA (MazF antagonist)